MAVDNGADAIGNILIVNDKMSGGVALIGPEGGAEFSAPYCLAPRYRAGRGPPPGTPVVSDLPTDSPRGSAKEWV